MGFVLFSKLLPDSPVDRRDCDQASRPYLISLQNPCMKCSWPGMQQQVSIRANGVHWGILPRLKSLPIDEVVCLKAETDVVRAVLAEPLTGSQVKSPIKTVRHKMLRINICN